MGSKWVKQICVLNTQIDISVIHFRSSIVNCNMLKASFSQKIYRISHKLAKDMTCEHTCPRLCTLGLENMTNDE